jgi:hypothetical protein
MYNKQKPHIINQGSYGCIFKPGFDCRGHTLRKNYISKLQIKNDVSIKESIIGERVRKIPKYRDYFSPIESTCEVTLGKIKNDDIEKCEPIQKARKQSIGYESAKMLYIGKDTLEDFFFNKIIKRHGIKIIDLKTIINTHIHLLDGFQLLGENNIIHLDVKENNIIMNRLGIPIIIDFGLSVEIDKIEKSIEESNPLSLDELIEQYDKRGVFFSYGPEYNPWCIDICILTFMFNEINTDKTPFSWKDSLITKEQIEKIVKDFYYNENRDKHNNIKQLLTETPNYMKIQFEYLENWIGKQWKYLFEELMKYKYTWDNYAVAVMYIGILKDLNLWDLPIMQKYNIFLNTVLTSLPNNRVTIDKTKEIIISYFMNMNKKSVRKTKNKISIITSDDKDNIQNNMKITKIMNNNKDNEINNKLNN